MTACLGCGSPSAEGDPTPSHCPRCPAEQCEDCGGWNVWLTGDMCSCWISVEDMPLAEQKALFAHDGTFNVETDGTLTLSEVESK